ncbi:MAG: FliH/SctL family protein [Acidobacteriota bacterium]
MSSRVFSGGSDDAQPIEWRSAGGATTGGSKGSPGAAVLARGPHIAAKGTGPSARHLTEAASGSETEALVQAAYQQGLAAGEATAQQRAQALAAPSLKNFAAVVQQLSLGRQQARQEAEESMVRLALTIARRVLHREIATDPEAILGLVRAGLDRLTAREIHKLRLSPPDAAIALQNRAALNLPAAVEIVADATLAAGGAIFETSRGELDMSAQTQLEEIDRGFADVMHRRAR